MAELTLQYESSIPGAALDDVVSIVYKNVTRQFKVVAVEQRKVTQAGGTSGFTSLTLESV